MQAAWALQEPSLVTCRAVLLGQHPGALLSTSSDVATKLTHKANVPSTAFLNSDSSSVDDLKAHSATCIPMGDAAPKSPCYCQYQEPETGSSSFKFYSSLKFLCKHIKSPRGHLLRYHFQPFAAGMFSFFFGFCRIKCLIKGPPLLERRYGLNATPVKWKNLPPGKKKKRQKPELQTQK